MSLLYKYYYRKYCLYTEDYIDSLIEQQWNTPIQQAINRVQCKLLEEIFIIVVHLIFSF
jgi:type III secretory pathway component EscU